MHSVDYIKKKAIEIADNSSHMIIIGFMNHKDVSVDCSSVIDSESEYSRMESYLSVDELFSRRIYRTEARMQRRNDRIERRKNRINKL